MNAAPRTGPDLDPPILNPWATLVLVRARGDVVAVTVTAPVRGRPLQITPVTRAREPEVFALLRRLAAKAGPFQADLDEATWARLREIGVLVPRSAVSRSVHFHCSPFDPPSDLVPRRAAATEAPARERVCVAPSLRLDDAPPTAGGGAAWASVAHPDAAVPSVLSFGEPDRALLRALVPGEAPPADLASGARAALAAAGVLIDPDADARRRTAWSAARAGAAAHLARHRYAVLRGLVPPTQIAALRRYYRELTAEGWVSLGDGQVPRRYHAHNEPIASWLHRQLTPLVGALAGEPVKPSYAYFAAYLPGAVLEPHRDRAQCALSLSLHVDYAPEPDDRVPWPLYVEADGHPRGTAAVHLGLGDALVYRGGELTHFRDALPAGHASTSLFFHYVPETFTGSLD